MKRVIIVGSVRTGGRSAHLADELMEACIEDCPEDELAVLSVASLDVAGCIGCDGCKPKHPEEHAVDALPCVIEDDFGLIREHLEDADELIVVTPVYFSGVPSQLKAVLDRLQPYFWTDRRHGDKRPLMLHIVGEGKDPFGFEGVIASVSSAALCAGFELDKVYSWVGKIDRDGVIQADAEEIEWS